MALRFCIIQLLSRMSRRQIQGLGLPGWEMIQVEHDEVDVATVSQGECRQAGSTAGDTCVDEAVEMGRSKWIRRK